MYDTLEMTEKRLVTFESELETTDFELGNSRLAITVIISMSACVGIWGIACLVSGLAQSSGLQETGRALIMALTGM